MNSEEERWNEWWRSEEGEDSVKQWKRTMKKWRSNEGEAVKKEQRWRRKSRNEVWMFDAMF